MYKNKYIKYKEKYTQLCNKIYVGGEINSYDVHLIKYLKNKVDIFKKVFQKNISQDVWSIIRLQTIIGNLYHLIPLQITTNFYNEWIKKNSSNQNELYLEKMRICLDLLY